MNDHDSSLAVKVTLSDDAVEARLVDRRAFAVETFGPLSDAERESLAVDAWTLGLRALRSAYRQAEEARLQDIGRSLVEDVDRRLRDHVSQQERALLGVLTRYFDPRDGQVIARLESFLRDDGELARAMNRYLAPDHGILAELLARQVGEQSPLLRRLSPTDSEGIIQMLGEKLRETLASSQTDVARALDPASEDGPVARFLRVLRRELQAAESDRHKQLAAATKALDTNDPASPLSVLIREMADARSVLLKSVNPDIAGSPMASIRASLTGILEQHTKLQQTALTAFQERQAKLEIDLREALAKLDERRHAAAKSPRGGLGFQDAVLRFVQSAVRAAPVIAEVTANSVGARAGCKVGDQVVRFTKESIYEGAAIVVEAKHDAGYGVEKALAEMEIARANRNAGGGVFVMARSRASAAFPYFARYGADILVTWDQEDETTDPYLHAALLLALGLAARRRRPEDPGNLNALAKIEGMIQKELDRHARMQKSIATIEKQAEELSRELGTGTEKLQALLGKAKATLKALNVELTEGDDERRAPVLLARDSLPKARATLGRRAADAKAG